MSDDRDGELAGRDEEPADRDGPSSPDAAEDGASAAEGSPRRDEEFADRVEQWLVKQMPIIQMHGGTSSVRAADPETGEVVIELGGGCAGCDVSEITAGNIEQELLQWDDVEEVTVRVPETGDSFGVDQPESVMGIDRTEGGRGDFKGGRW